ncbi:hypothetical protein [Microbacterium sp.]|uniref:hypothetical protein n=1 Tax=Microbacterium sp. TaxID=51671 RepID=UPI002810B41F|nr:hypothetical protein [Microbacterium sp.]
MRLDVRRSRELTALVQVLATVPKEVAKQVRAQSKAVIVPEWKKGLAERAPARIFFDRLVNPSTVYVSDRGVRLIAGSNAAKAFPRETEFGAYREDYKTYTTRRGETTRRTKRQFWHFQPKGRVVIPTVAAMIPRIAALWVQTSYRTVAELIERAR